MSDFVTVKSSPTAYTDAAIGIPIQLFNTQLVHSIIVTLKRQDKGDKNGHFGIKAIKLSSAGRVLYETTNMWESQMLGGEDVYGHNNLDFDIIPYGSERHDWSQFAVIPFANSVCDTSKIAGCCAFKNLNSVKLEVIPNNPTHATDAYVATAYVRYYQAIATSAQSGRISISLSS